MRVIDDLDTHVARFTEALEARGGRVYVAGTAGDANAYISEVCRRTEAKLAGKSQPFVWRLWEQEWRPGRPGKYTLLARAIDGSGRVQPLQRDRDRLNYMISHVLPVEVTVR